MILSLATVSTIPLTVANIGPLDGPRALKEGERLFSEQRYDEAATELWKAVVLHGQTPPDRQYDVQQVFSMFMKCYVIQDKAVDGLVFVASESFQRNQDTMGKQYLQQALTLDPNHEGALQLQKRYVLLSADEDEDKQGNDGAQTPHDTSAPSPEELYTLASNYFSNKEYEKCADVFELSCRQSNFRLGPSCANAVYCRNMILDWGFNGTQFKQDMERVEVLTRQEARDYRVASQDSESFLWKRSTSVHPHMMLGYPLQDAMLKRYSAESAAYMDEKMARVGLADKDTDDDSTVLPDLPPDLPFDTEIDRLRIQSEVEDEGREKRKIRVGFVGSGFNSKAVLYLSQDMFRFFDRDAFEVHIFSFGPPDSPYFIEHGMRGVDWRERVKANVDYFHDCQQYSRNHIAAARFIHEKQIDILVEWDGYARQGQRAQGLFALRPAPIQMLHQEYLGTSGALHVDYIFSDVTASPPHLQGLYTEKIIYLPNHFFSKGHAYQAEVKEPTHEYVAKSKPGYEMGRGTPQENRCMAPAGVGPEQTSFVFCNFNKFLKNNPETVRSWIRILREVPDSILCLLENPSEGVPYLRKFVHEAAGTSDGDNDFESFVPGDGDALNDRIHFLPWEKNPFDHQARNQDFCNVMLDSYPYNGHTVAQDALYGGVPIVTRSDGEDMASRVTTSANRVLGLEGLNGDGPHEYEEIAIRLGNDEQFFHQTRTKLIDSSLQRNPMHPYWDVARYVKNFEVGLKSAFEAFVSKSPKDHIFVQETAEAQRGTYDDEILAHPPSGR